MSPEDWRGDALCAQTDPEIFFPEKGGSTKAAKSTCARCPVVTECLDYALSQPGNLEGIWGGLAPRERRAMRRGKPRPSIGPDPRALEARRLKIAGADPGELAEMFKVTERTIYRWTREAA